MTQQEFYKRYSYNAHTDLLGSGGFGKVFKAWDNVDDCEVALKIQPVNAQFPNLRLKNEVEIAAQYRHPNIARYKECYTFTESGGDTDIAVMSYYKDGSLDKLLKARTLTFEQSVDILMQTLDAIAYLHRNDVIHRDLKPQNILILHHNGRYIPKITDFGISKQLNGEDSSAVTNSLLGGTRYYASPEQLQATTIRKNTDLWSFGVIAYQMLTGSLPFNCGTFSPSGEDGRVELYRQMQAGILPDGIKGIAEPWQTLIRQCLVVDNNARIAHAEDCIKIISGTTVVGGGTTGGAGRGGGKPSGPKKRSSKRGGLWWVILLVLALLSGGDYAVASLLDSGDEPVVESESTMSASEMYDKGDVYYESENYTEAVKWYRKAADHGLADAQFDLGVYYENGWGVTQSYTEAVKWYRKAARQGYKDAQNRLRTLGESW